MDRIEPSIARAPDAAPHPPAAGGPPRDDFDDDRGAGRAGRNAAIAVLLLVAAAGGGWYWYAQQPAPIAPAPPRAEAPVAPAEPVIEHPLAPADNAAALPPLAASDALLADTLNGLLGATALQRLVVTQDFVRRFVAFVDNLSRPTLARGNAPVRPAAGPPLASGSGEARAFDRAHFARYAPYVQLAEATDPVKLVAAYVRLYPLFQQAYVELGYPSGYFNDRVVQTIDHLLVTPEVSGPLRVVQPKVHYEFADPTLEALSAGQKALLRMGPENAARIKARLRLLRAEILRNSEAR